MEISRLMDLQAGSRLERLIMEKNISFATEEKILVPLLKKKKEQSKELHYRTVLLLSDILERTNTESEAIRMIQEKFPE